MSGKINKNIIVNLSSGEEFRSYYSLSELVRMSSVNSDAQIYELINDYFARFAHTKMKDIPLFVSEDAGFSLHPEERPSETAILITLFHCYCLTKLLYGQSSNGDRKGT